MQYGISSGKRKAQQAKNHQITGKDGNRPPAPPRQRYNKGSRQRQRSK
jgi:hypothetical protein